jgi:hypothetical protein
MSEDAPVVHHGAVHQNHVPGRLPTMTAVDVTEDVQPWLDPEQGSEQVLAALMPAQNVVLVQSSVRRLMGNEHVRVVRDAVPVLS